MAQSLPTTRRSGYWRTGRQGSLKRKLGLQPEAAPWCPVTRASASLPRRASGWIGSARGTGCGSPGSLEPAAPAATASVGGKPLRPTRLHRLHPRRRLRRVNAGRPALLLPHPGGLRRRGSRSASVREPDRLPLAHAGRRAGRLGTYGSSAAAHIVAQAARHQRRQVYAFTGDE